MSDDDSCNEEQCNQCKLREDALEKALCLMDELNNLTLAALVDELVPRLLIYNEGKCVNESDTYLTVWPAGGKICIEYAKQNSPYSRGKED